MVSWWQLSPPTPLLPTPVSRSFLSFLQTVFVREKHRSSYTQGDIACPPARTASEARTPRSASLSERPKCPLFLTPSPFNSRCEQKASQQVQHRTAQLYTRQFPQSTAKRTPTPRFPPSHSATTSPSSPKLLSAPPSSPSPLPTTPATSHPPRAAAIPRTPQPRAVTRPSLRAVLAASPSTSPIPHLPNTSSSSI